MSVRPKALGFLTLFLLVCCKGQRANDAQLLKLALGSEPPVLDAQLADTGVSVFVLRQVLSTLLDYDPQQRIVDADAESHQWSADGRNLQIRLRTGLTWSDGAELKACEYRAGILRALDPAVPSALSEVLFEIQGARERKAGKIDEKQVGITCDDASGLLTLKALRPHSSKLLHSLAFIVSAPTRSELVAKYGAEWLLPRDGKPGIASGAFQISEWSHDRRVHLVARQMTERNLPADRRSGVNEVDLPIVRDLNTAYAMYKSGALDALDDLPTAFLTQIKNDPEHVVAPYFTTYMVGFSLTANPALKKVNVRRALALTANQGEIPSLLGGGESPAYGWIPPGLLPESARPVKPIFDPARAVEELDEAGFQERSRFPQLKLFFNSGERHQLLMERLAHNWQQYLGISVQLEPIEWKVLVARLKTSPPDLYRYAWAAVYPDPVFFLELFLSDGLNNFGHWKNARYDKLVHELENTPIENRDKGFWEKLQEAQTILTRDDPALVPIYHYVKNALIRKGISGLDFSGQGISRLRLVHKSDGKK